MSSFDTNLLARILTRDDEGKVAITDRLLDASVASGEQFFVPISGILELEWVLRSVHCRARADVVRALNALLENASLVVQHHEEVDWRSMRFPPILCVRMSQMPYMSQFVEV